MTKRIGLTGGIACGKSEVADRLLHHRVPVVDTDHLGHELLGSGSPVFDRLVERFGQEMIGTDGNISRHLLGKLVFADEQARTDLNGIVHPEIGKRWREWLTDQQGPLAVVAVPLLFESGLEKEFDGVLCVWSPESEMIKRLKTRNLTENEAVLRVQAQMPVDLKAEKANWVLKNDRTLEHLQRQVDDWVKQWIP